MNTNAVKFCQLLWKPITYVPINGNMGDALIAAGTQMAFEAAGIRWSLATKPYQKDATLVVAGCGNLVPYYRDVANVLEQALVSPVGQVVVLPQTIAGHEALLARLDERFHVFCRDLVSYAHVKKHVTKACVYLDHDMATHVKMDRLYAGYQNSIGKAHPDLLRHVERVLRYAADHAWQHKRHGWLLRRDQEAAVPPADHAPNLDLSGMLVGIWGQPVAVAVVAGTFMRAISMFDAIETDRLHVALCAGILGIPVQFRANSYFKNRAVFEFTIQSHYPSVTMV